MKLTRAQELVNDWLIILQAHEHYDNGKTITTKELNEWMDQFQSFIEKEYGQFTSEDRRIVIEETIRQQPHIQA